MADDARAPTPFHARQRPALAVDIVVFTIRDAALQLLLIERGVAPFKGAWALPGGFVHTDESVDDAARRELVEETGVHDIYLEQLYTFGAVDRDPRGRVVSVAYFALIDASTLSVHGGTDAAQAAWHPLRALPPLAFDHPHIVQVAARRLRAKLSYAPVAFQLLPSEFTLSELQAVYEVILEQPMDKRNFRRKLLSLGLLEDTQATKRDGPHRPARLYRFRPERFDEVFEGGTLFPFAT